MKALQVKIKLVDESCMLNNKFQGYIKTQNQISDNFGFKKKNYRLCVKKHYVVFMNVKG